MRLGKKWRPAVGYAVKHVQKVQYWERRKARRELWVAALAVIRNANKV